MQLLYSLAPDIIWLRAAPGEEVKIEESEAAKAVKGKGTDIHLERGEAVRFAFLLLLVIRIAMLKRKDQVNSLRLQL